MTVQTKNKNQYILPNPLSGSIQWPPMITLTGLMKGLKGWCTALDPTRHDPGVNSARVTRCPLAGVQHARLNGLEGAWLRIAWAVD
jgi:hypothetical protein